MSDYDSPWKEALEQYFQAFMAFFFPLAHAEIDWSRGYEFLDKELQQVQREAELGRRVVDKLVKIWRATGDEEWILIHVEIQSQEESDFAQRMYVYHYRIFDRYNRQVVSLAMLADERAGWRPDRFEYSLWGCSVGFQFPVVKLLDYGADLAALESSTNPFATLVLAHLKTQETRTDFESRRAWKVRLVKGLYERGLSRKEVRSLFRFVDWMMDMPKGLDDRFWKEVQQFEQEKHMPYVTGVERRAEKRGLMKGIELGLKLKFGTEGQQLIPEIQRIDDIEVLENVIRAIEIATNVEEVRRTCEKDSQASSEDGSDKGAG